MVWSFRVIYARVAPGRGGNGRKFLKEEAALVFRRGRMCGSPLSGMTVKAVSWLSRSCGVWSVSARVLLGGTWRVLLVRCWAGASRGNGGAGLFVVVAMVGVVCVVCTCGGCCCLLFVAGRGWVVCVCVEGTLTDNSWAVLQAIAVE